MHSISKLKNGINLITVPVKGTKAVTVLAMFPIGSRYENKKISGASHFVEHLMFKGTKKRPTSLDISRELDAAGAHFNAFTYKDYTGYYVKIDGKQQKLAYDILSDMLFCSKFEPEEIEKEKGVITEEIRMYDDNPIMAVDNLFDKAMFGEHPLGWDIAGTEKSVKNITRNELWDYYKSAYRPNNMVLVAAGDVDKKGIEDLKKYFEKETPRSESSGKNCFQQNEFLKFFWPEKILPLEKRIEVGVRKVDQAQVILGFPGLSYFDKKKYAASVLLSILGGSMSSRLFVEVREKRGLAYSIGAGSVWHLDVGAAQIQAGLDPERLKEAVKVIKDELRKISSELVGKKELAEAKSNISGRTVLSMEDSSAQAELFAKQFWFSPKMETYEEVLKKIEKVTAVEARDLAKQIFVLNKMRVAVIGPYGKKEILEIFKD
ncbi:MAG: pitrilysin family protein [Patescibacteria group bacterium]|nr:pitrilysin family protein [Patescibacteria group bacterium]